MPCCVTFYIYIQSVLSALSNPMFFPWCTVPKPVIAKGSAELTRRLFSLLTSPYGNISWASLSLNQDRTHHTIIPFSIFSSSPLFLSHIAGPTTNWHVLWWLVWISLIFLWRKYTMFTSLCACFTFTRFNTKVWTCCCYTKLFQCRISNVALMFTVKTSVLVTLMFKL